MKKYTDKELDKIAQEFHENANWNKLKPVSKEDELKIKIALMEDELNQIKNDFYELKVVNG
jgi:hypothetical protein